MTDRGTPRAPDPADPFALESLVAQHYERLLRVAVLVCRDHDDAEDAVQLALERAWRHADELREADRLAAWLRRIVVREALRIEGRRRGFFARWLAGPREIEVADQPGPDQDMPLREALASLPAEQRSAVVLHHLEGYSVEETAGALGVPVETARSRLRVARQKMRAALGNGS